MESELRRWGVDQHVKFVGWVGFEEVPGLVREADICVEPAQASELNERSTMIKLAEYLALEKPVIAYDMLETRRTVGDAAVLVRQDEALAFAEHIARLANDPFRRLTLAQRAREHARTLTWEQSEAALLHVYSSLSAAHLSHPLWRPDAASWPGWRRRQWTWSAPARSLCAKLNPSSAARQ